jgi:hypothetical protein
VIQGIVLYKGETMEKECFRIVEVKNGKVMSLFHGTNGSREIPLDMWVACTKKEVSDGRGNYHYQSGFHAIDTLDNAVNFFNTMFRIKQNRYIVPCKIRGNIRPKREGQVRRAALLADEIYISSEDVKKLI